MRLPPRGVNRHHPYRLLARVINAISTGTIQDRYRPVTPRQANYNRPSSRARLTAALRCSTRSLRYSARWWVFTVLSETYSRAPISRRDNRVASRRRTSNSLGVSSSSTAHPSLREGTVTPALGSAEVLAPGATRFLIDFSGGELSYYMIDPTLVEVVATTSAGSVLRTFLTPNSHISGFRAGLDIAIAVGQSCDVRVFLRAANKALTETWTFPWRA